MHVLLAHHSFEQLMYTYPIPLHFPTCIRLDTIIKLRQLSIYKREYLKSKKHKLYSNLIPRCSKIEILHVIDRIHYHFLNNACAHSRFGGKTAVVKIHCFWEFLKGLGCRNMVLWILWNKLMGFAGGILISPHYITFKHLFDTSCFFFLAMCATMIQESTIKCKLKCAKKLSKTKSWIYLLCFEDAAMWKFLKVNMLVVWPTNSYHQICKDNENLCNKQKH